MALFCRDTSGPEPEYHMITTGTKMFHSKEPFHMKYNNGILPEIQIAYETWGELNEDRDNAVLISAGLSASSHAKSHEVCIADTGQSKMYTAPKRGKVVSLHHLLPNNGQSFQRESL